MAQIVDLALFVGKAEKALVGRDNGEAVLEKVRTAGLDFEKMEKSAEKILVKIPREVVSVNKSFFLGLFELSIQRMGSAQKFFDKYDFETTDHIKNKVRDHAEAALLKASQKDILNG